MKNGVLIAVLMVLVVAAGGIYFFWQNDSNSSAPNQATGTTGNSNQIAVGEPNPTTDESSQNTSIPKSYDVEIKSYSFSPLTITIKSGDSITWTNLDSAPHTVTSDSGSELDSESFSNGNSYSHTFTTAGTYEYYCNIHTSMKGTVIVE